jgi:hypothetical protein
MHSDNTSLEETTPEERAMAAEAVAQQAVARYREMVAASPGLVADLVHGDSIDAIDASAEAARRAYSEISRQVAQSYERSVPAGNPARSDSTLGADTLKPEAKIALGLRTTSRRS